MSQLYVQAQPLTLYGSGASLGATSIVLENFNGIDGTPLAMADFGTIGYLTMEPGSSTQEEQVSFSGLTTNANGTVTLTGIHTVLFISPYTSTSGLAKSHAGATRVVISNTSAFYSNFANKLDDETISGNWTFTNKLAVGAVTSSDTGDAATVAYVNSVAVAGAPNASTTVKGIVQEATLAQTLAKTASGSTGARLYINPSEQNAVQFHDPAVSSSGTDAYAITLSPVPTAYATGDMFVFKADVANTGNATLNVNGLGAKTILDQNGSVLIDSNITASSWNIVVYDGTNLQLISSSGSTPISQSGREVYGASTTGNDTYVVTLSPVPTAYFTGMTLRVNPNTSNTGASSLNVNGLGVKTLKRPGGADTSTGDIIASSIFTTIYDGTNFQLPNLVPSALVAGPTSDASSLHNHAPLFYSSATTSISGAATSTPVTYTISAGLLSTAFGFRVRCGYLVGSSNGAGGSFGIGTITIKLDSTTLFTDNLGPGNSTSTMGVELMVMNNASASAQTGFYSASGVISTPDSRNLAAALTASVNTALAKDITIVLSSTNNNGAGSVSLYNVTIDLII